ncbi:MAG: CopG family transcriptional regulator [Candidatus Omnitrophica bacterium]|nr:CopG family transcriptional regulator [Candidatus Omnitrophota bacterium]
MKKIKSDQDMPEGELTRVKDFLPPPDQLVMPEPTVKVTIALKKSSVEFFKKQAKKHHAKYQKMIRELLDHYASIHKAA